MDIVVLAAQAHQQHAARIGVFGDGRQQLLCHPVVVPQLGAAGIVRKRKDTVAGIAEVHGSQLCQHVRRVVGAGDRGNNPDLVAHPHRAVFAAVAFERWSRGGGRRARRGRCSRRPRLSRPHAVGWAVLVFQRALQVGAHIVGVHPGACGYPLCGASDGIAVLDHVLARLQVGQSHLVPPWYGLRSRAAAARKLNLTAGRKLFQRDGHVVRLVYFKVGGLQRITAFISPINRPASASTASRDGRLKHSKEQ